MTVSVIQTSCTAKGGEPARFDIAWDESALDWNGVMFALSLDMLVNLGMFVNFVNLDMFVNLCIVIDSLLSVVCVYLPPFSK